MITVKFFNLLRSNHGLSEMQVQATSVYELVERVRALHPSVTISEFEQAVLFINQQKVMHLKRFDEPLKDGDVVVFTNFVGGG